MAWHLFTRTPHVTSPPAGFGTPHQGFIVMDQKGLFGFLSGCNHSGGIHRIRWLAFAAPVLRNEAHKLDPSVWGKVARTT